MMAEAVQKRGFAPRFGYDNIDWEAHWLNSVMGTLRFAILWTDVDYLADDLRATLARAPAQVDRQVLKRNAKDTFNNNRYGLSGRLGLMV
jgi:hypothetical protein